MPQQPKNARRSFFAILGGTAAVGVAAKLASETTVPSVSDAAKAQQGDGYRLTDHIKKYYRTTTI